MPRVSLTERSIKQLAAPDPSGKQVLHFDTKIRGFGVLCSGTTDAKSYIAQRKVDGKTVRVTIGPVNLNSLAVARNKAVTALAEMANGINPVQRRQKIKAQNVTLGDALETYLNNVQGLKPRTQADYREKVERHFKAWVNKPLAEIRPEMVEARYSEILGEVAAFNAQMNRAGDGRYAANGAMRVLRLLYNYAVDHDSSGTIPQRNPVKVLQRSWRKESRRDRVVSLGELPIFMKAVERLKNPIVADYIKLVLFTGLRRREASRLVWESAGVVAGASGVVSLKNKEIILAAEETKAGRQLILPMSNIVYEVLNARHGAGVISSWVFPANSKSGHLEEPKKAFDEIFKATDVKVSVHNLRDTFITVAEASGIAPYALKALVNHALPSGDVTAGYIKMDAERLKEPVQQVANSFIRALAERFVVVDAEGQKKQEAETLLDARKFAKDTASGIFAVWKSHSILVERGESDVMSRFFLH